MLNRIKLTNFRQHRDREFNLKDGLVVLRGSNESGKSTLLSAMMYLWFGSKVLSEPISDIVTYGEPEKSLRVEGSFTIDGVNYEAYRAPSGAELRYGDQLVTGQTGVTQFMERLLGAKADVVKKLMVAEQNSVRGILESDSNAGALIEGLADLGLIDTLIDKVKTQLPSGPTKGAEAALAALQSAVGTEPVAPSDSAVQAAEAAVGEAHQEHAEVEELLEFKRGVAQQASDVLKEAAAASAAFKAVQQREAALKAVQKPAECKYTSSDVASAEALERDAEAMAKARREFAVEFEPSAATWTGDEAGLQAYIDEQRKCKSEADAEVADLRVKRAAKLAVKINDGVCSFCKQDISKLPEVAEVNAKADEEVLAIDKQVDLAKAKSAEAASNLKSAEAISKLHAVNLRKANSQFWEPIAGTLPCAFKWIGPVLADSQAQSVPSSAMKVAIREYETAEVRYTAAQQELLTLSYPALQSESDVLVARSKLDDYESYKPVIAGALEVLRSKQSALASAKAVLAVEQREYEAAVQRREKAQSDVGSAEKLLADMEFNNQLIKDLQAARSEIRRRLWDSVTAAISVYFSRIRQVETRITQSEDGFLQNGKPIKGLSGSAKDMLGLAVRAGLLKTFIPGAPIMVVDEPFSGCDDDREVAGLGVLSAMGFPQTILVTHSDLADSLANQLVQL